MQRASLWAALILSTATGCPSEGPAPQPARPTPRPAEQTGAPPASKPLTQTVLVIDDSQLARSIGLLRGEWNAQSGYTLKVRSATLDEVLAGDALEADVVCYASRRLGELATRGWVRPLRTSVLDGPLLAADDLLPLIRHAAMIYDGQVHATPLACQLTMLGVPRSQADAWERPPATYDRLQQALQKDDGATLYASAVDHPFRPAELWFAAAAAHAAKPPVEPLLFDPETMQPTFGPPSLRASPFAEGLVAAAELTARLESSKSERPDDATLLWMRLPGVGDGASGPAAATSLTNEGSRVTVLGLADRQAHVTTQTRNTAAAFRLLAWLASADQTKQLIRGNDSLTACRESLLPRPASTQGGDEAWAGQREALTAAALNEDRWVRIPRIPGIDDYLAALTTAVEEVASEQLEPEAALAAAAARLEAITDRLGRAEQREAYRRHLELP